MKASGSDASDELGQQPSPPAGGGWPLIDGWARATLSPQGARLWQTLNHRSACLSCAWGTGGQTGGFRDELGEPLQRCLKSVEAIQAELQPAVPRDVFAGRTLAELQQLSSADCDRLGRLDRPLIRRSGSDHYEPIGWKEVHALTAAAFRQPAPERVASYSSGRSSNEAAYLLQLLLRALGSNNLADCSDLCHAPSSVGLGRVFGSGTSNVSLESLRQADGVVLIGSNAPANHPRLMNELIRLRERGGTVIVINPVLEAGLLKFGSPAFPIRSMLGGGSKIASLFLQPIPGSDTAVLLGIQKALLESDAIAWEFVKAHSDGWPELIAQIESTSWESITGCCGLSREELAHTAARLAACRAVVFAWAMGITHHANGTTNVQAIANTAVLTGNVGRPGAGTMPIRGHSNVQGFGSMGVSVRLREPMRLALEHLLGRPLSRTPGYHTRDLIDAAERGDVDTLLCLGGNLFGANPDSAQARRALGRIDTIVYLATKPNTGHFHGLAARQTLLLPVFNRFETPHRTTVESGNNWVRLNEPGSTHLRRGGGSLTKILRASGTAQAVVLTERDLTILGNGSISVSAVATDAAGNASAPASTSFALDTEFVAAPVLMLDSDGVSVSAERGASVVVTFSQGAAAISRTLVASGAAQPVVLSEGDLQTLGAGTIEVSAVATDVAGNVSEAATVSFVLDSLAPAVVSPMPAAGPDNAAAGTGLASAPAMVAAPLLQLGSGVAGGATAQEATQASGVVTMSAARGASVVVTFSQGAAAVSKTLVATGSAQPVVLSEADLQTLGDGTIEVTAVATDAAGQVRTAVGLSFELDTLAPAAPLLELGSGVGDGATALEATQAGGVVMVSAERGASVEVTFQRSSHLISEVVFLAELAHRLHGDDPIDWRRLQDPIYVRELIARTVPGYEAMAGIDASRREFEVGGRVFQAPRFPTATGRAQLAVTPLPDLKLPGPEHFGGLAAGEQGLVLNLITARSYGQHNTVVYKPGDRYRGMEHRQTLLINPEDLAASGLRPRQRVTVQGEAGVLEGIELIPGAIRRGAALMFFPEANVLMRGHHDPHSGTPAYKRVPVLVRG